MCIGGYSIELKALFSLKKNVPTFSTVLEFGVVVKYLTLKSSQLQIGGERRDNRHGRQEISEYKLLISLLLGTQVCSHLSIVRGHVFHSAKDSETNWPH